MSAPPRIIKDIPLPPPAETSLAATADPNMADATAGAWTLYNWLSLLLLIGGGIMVFPLFIEMLFMFVVSYLASYRG